MTIRMSAGTVTLAGICPAEDAEVLLQHLLEKPGVAVDWRGCEAAHTAVIQVLLAAKPQVLGPPATDQLATWVQPLLDGGSS